jgi:hypothetical protein
MLGNGSTRIDTQHIGQSEIMTPDASHTHRERERESLVIRTANSSTYARASSGRALRTSGTSGGIDTSLVPVACACSMHCKIDAISGAGRPNRLGRLCLIAGRAGFCPVYSDRVAGAGVTARNLESLCGSIKNNTRGASERNKPSSATE